MTTTPTLFPPDVPPPAPPEAVIHSAVVRVAEVAADYGRSVHLTETCKEVEAQLLQKWNAAVEDAKAKVRAECNEKRVEDAMDDLWSEDLP